MKGKSILIAGVGGQGNILASKVIAIAAMKVGYDVKISETHGMAQRGGSVHSMIRFGEVVYSPLIPHGTCDCLISLEIIEGLRWVEYMKQDSVILVSTEKRPPYSVSVGKASYPENVEEIYGGYGKAFFLPAHEIAFKAGSVRSANVVMIGAYSYLEDAIPPDILVESLKERFKGKESLIQINLRAFEYGYSYAEKNF